MNNTSPTFHLFAKPSFIEGIARCIDIGATLQIYNESKTSREADFIALFNDWLTVGDDIRAAIKKYERGGEKTTK